MGLGKGFILPLLEPLVFLHKGLHQFHELPLGVHVDLFFQYIVFDTSLPKQVMQVLPFLYFVMFHTLDSPVDLSGKGTLFLVFLYRGGYVFMFT